MSGIDDPAWRDANPGTMARLLAQLRADLTPGDERHAELYGQIVEWLYASYVQDGRSEEELDGMDVEAAADELIRQATPK